MRSNESVTSNGNSLTSVGIDIGTTSCHLVFSRLNLHNEASATQIPRLVISSREIVYESPIFLTPLKSDGSIDGAKVAELMRIEYSHAGITPDDINCGAVIITGETARLRNAEQVLHEISCLAGDFVAASAGPELESILSGRGSGALQYSKDSGKTVCNIDIGGGTTNIAVFKNGELIETSCLRIGGRCFQFSADGVLTKQSESGIRLSEILTQKQDDCNGIAPGAHLSIDSLISLGHIAAGLILDFVYLPNQARIQEEGIDTRITTKDSQPEPDGLEGLLIGSRMSVHAQIDKYWFSGGVAELMMQVFKLGAPAASLFKQIDPFVYTDFGYFLATGICEGIEQRNFPHRIAKNPIRATVVGAGSYSVQLSGNTVSAAISHLPRKSIPLVRLFDKITQTTSVQHEEISNRLTRAISSYDKRAPQKSFAIILHFDSTPRYADLRNWASVLAFACERSELCLPYVFIVNTDSAMALGQLLRGELKHDDVIVLDGIDLANGDFIDIGKPINSGSTIPVTVKSLFFSNE